MARVLYWRPGTASVAPHAALAEADADYTLVRIDRETAQSDSRYLSLNPLGVVPTLVDEERGLVLTEAAAIMLHLGDEFPEARLAPAERSRYYRFLVFLTNTLQTSMLRVLYPERYGGGEVGAVSAAEAKRAFGIVEDALAGGEWLAAEHRTGADLFLFMLTRWGRRLDPPAWDRPVLRDHLVRTATLPGVRRMLREQELELPDWAIV